MNVLYALAIYTLLLQGALMPVLLVLCTRWIIQSGVTTKKEKPKKEKLDPLPNKKLQPLKCENCGAALALGGGKLLCNLCGHVTEEPPDYRDVFTLRRRAIEQLHAGCKYIIKAQRMTSPWVRWLIALLGIWLFASVFIVIVASETDKRFDPLFNRLGDWVAYPMFISLGLWVIVAFFTAGMLTQIRKKLPTISDWSQIGSEEERECAECGGGVQFQRGDLVALCGFCGTETLRTQVVWAAKRAAAADAGSTEASLLEGQAALQSAVDDLIGTPAILLFIFVFLPFVLCSPWLLWVAFQEWPIWTAGFVALAISVTWVIKRTRRSQPRA